MVSKTLTFSVISGSKCEFRVSWAVSIFSSIEIMIMMIIMKRLNNIFYFRFGNCNHCRHIFISCLSDRINYYTRSDQLFNGKPSHQYGVPEGKAEELKEKGVGRLQGTHPVPGTKSRIESMSDDTPARKKLRQDMEDRVVKVAKRRLPVEQSPKEKCEDWVKKAAESGYLFVPAPEEDIDDNIHDENETLPLEKLSTKEAETPIVDSGKDSKFKSRKTPKESRTEKPKIKPQELISKVDKKTFKEAFNTDKTRLDKRQVKYSKPKDFLLIVKDNIGSAVCTSDKYMAYGRGKIAEDCYGEGAKFNKDDYYIHNNPQNFEEEKCDEKMSENEEDILEEEQEEEAHPNVTKEKEKIVSKPLTKYDLHLLATKPKPVHSLYREISYNSSLES